LVIGEGVPYDGLVDLVLEFVLRAAIAEASDAFEWEHEELRRAGLCAIEFFRDGRALWWDRESFEAEAAEGERNQLDVAFFERLDGDLRARLRRAGYDVPSLIAGMKPLYHEIAADVADRCAGARQNLLTEILQS
jgi:hypothetical protein